jgi:predicted outer membrane protein
MKHGYLRICFAVAICLTVAVVGFAQSKQGRTTPSSSTTTDTAFLKKAMEENKAEVELGRLAESKAENQRVKEFGEMMVRDHTEALKKLQEASGGTIRESDIQLSKEHQQLRDRLSKLSGASFDREYMNAMVLNHQRDVRAFQAEAGTTGGSSSQGREKPENEPSAADESNKVKSVARELLPMLQMHLTDAQVLQGELQPQR